MSPLQKQVIPINLGIGMDTKTDPKEVSPSKALVVTDGVYTSPRRVQKRDGTVSLPRAVAGGTSLVNPRLAQGYQDELFLADNGEIVTYSESQQAWVSRGGYRSVKTNRESVNQTLPGSGFSDCAVLGNYVLYTWTTASQQDADAPETRDPAIWVQVVDQTTGAILYGPAVVDFNTTGTEIYQTRALVLGGTTLAFTYKKADDTQILMRRVVFSGAGVVSLSSSTVVATSDSFTWDILGTATGGAIVYQSASGITTALINTSGVVTSSNNIVDAAATPPFHMCLDEFNHDIWIYWNDTTYTTGDPSANTIVYAIYSSALAVVLGKTTVVVQGDPFVNINMSAVSTSSGHQTLYYTEYFETGTDIFSDLTSSYTLTSAGVSTTTNKIINGVCVFSRIFKQTLDGVENQYMVIVFRSGVSGSYGFKDQPTYFLVQLTNIPDTDIPLVVSRFAYGLVNNQAMFGADTGQTTTLGTISYTPNVKLIASDTWIFACTLLIQSFPGDYFEDSQVFPKSPGGLPTNFVYRFDFDHPDAYRCTLSSNLAVLNGGLIQMYDGESATELGYHLAPEIITFAQDTSAGSVQAGLYDYLAIYQWVDAQGGLHQSDISVTQDYEVTTNDSEVFITVTTAYLSQKDIVTVAVYRTTDLNKGGGQVYYLISDPVFLNDASPGALTVEIKDLLSDDQLAGNPVSYTAPASSVLANTTPPPSMIQVSHNNRFWFVDDEARDTIWYTKSNTPGVGISPSAFMTIDIDPKLGDISALGEMDDKLVSFKEKGMVVISGDGVNDTGTGSTLTFPQFVPSDVGCSVLKSVITMPMGIMFKSPNGIYLLDRSLGVSYFGQDMEAFNSSQITSATLIPTKTQVRFLTEESGALVYDYTQRSWSYFTNHSGVSATNFQELYVFIRDDAQVMKTEPGSYVDISTPYRLSLTLAWLHLGDIQGFQRVRRFALLGDYQNSSVTGHGVQVSVAYDFDPTYSTLNTYYFGAPSATGDFQYRDRLVQQKCDTLSIKIEEVVNSGVSGEYLDLTDMSFEAGMKSGLNRLPGGQTL